MRTHMNKKGENEKLNQTVPKTLTPVRFKFYAYKRLLKIFIMRTIQIFRMI